MNPQNINGIHLLNFLPLEYNRTALTEMYILKCCLPTLSKHRQKQIWPNTHGAYGLIIV